MAGGGLNMDQLNDQLRRAERAVARAAMSGMSREQLTKLEAHFHNMKERATKQVAAYVKAQNSPKTPPERILRMTIQAMEMPNHWLAREYRAHMLRMIEGNSRIPDAYRSQLPNDVAAVLRACPSAAGLVRELTLRGQRGATASAGKLGSNANSAIGAAYEIMGTAALTKSVYKSSNGGRLLHIDVGRDLVTFGDKMTVNRQPDADGKMQYPTRGTVENDLRIWRDGREIGIDFKHVKDAGKKGSSADLRNQVENVVTALQHGQLHEYNFVTNGAFSETFKGVISDANDKLAATGHARISMFEYVTTLATDPANDGAAG